MFKLQDHVYAQNYRRTSEHNPVFIDSTRLPAEAGEPTW